MEATCARAVEIGLPAVAFTEHADWTRWGGHEERGDVRGSVGEGGFLPPPLDLDGYLASIDRCRQRFPGLRILTGVEIGEPHLHRPLVDALLGAGAFERVLGSQHSLPGGDGGWIEVRDAYGEIPAVEVVRAYLGEVDRMLRADPPVSVLAHLDYPLRAWPADAGAFDAGTVEDELRGVLAVLASSGRALEVNTRLPTMPVVLDWWRQAGGDAVTFGSDAHRPDRLAARFREAAGLVAAHGFAPGEDPVGVWGRA